jgi:hypothetical protein
MELSLRGLFAAPKRKEKTTMPSDPDQDRDEAQGMDAEEAHYWKRRMDPMEEYCEYCEGFYGECECEEKREAERKAEEEEDEDE